MGGILFATKLLFMTKLVNLIPSAINLMESTRSIGYSFKSAVADLIDNSITAKASNIYVDFPRSTHKYLSIFDDGIGMDEDALIQAMRYGSDHVAKERDSADLGRFGLGLKMASLSQCRKLTVASKVSGGCISAVCWDLNTIGEEWNLQIIDQDALSDYPEYEKLKEVESGTAVIWENLDILMQGCQNEDSNLLQKRVSEVWDHLALVFHRYISYSEKLEEITKFKKSDLIKIYCNNTILEGIDPFISEKSRLVIPTEEYTPDRKKEDSIYISSWALPFRIDERTIKKIGNLQQYQGFYIYRNRRLIIRGSWFKLHPKNELSKQIRIQVDIPNSSDIDKQWKLDVKKSSATLPEELKSYLQKTVQNLHVTSRRMFTNRSRVKNTSNEFWKRIEAENGEITYLLNEDNELLKCVITKYPELKGLLKLISQTVPYDLIYADRADDSIITEASDTKEEFFKLLETIAPELAKEMRG